MVDKPKYENTCLNDAVIFPTNRKHAKFCNDTCRKAYARKQKIRENSRVLEDGSVEFLGQKPEDEAFDPTTAGVKTITISKADLKKDPRFKLSKDKSFSSPGLTKALDELDEIEAKDYKRSHIATPPSATPEEAIIIAKANKLGISVKEYKRRLAAFQKMGLAKVGWISTGIADFDALTQIPRGRITQIQGPYGVGKTTLCLNMVAGMTGSKVLYIDSEASLNPELMMDLGINDKNFTLYNKSAFLEDIAEVIRDAAKSGKYDVIVFDSLAAVSTRTIAEGEFTASNIGQKAKLMHKLVSLVQMPLKDSDTALVVINQEREVLSSYVPTKYTPGGMAIPYAASLMIALKTIKSWRFPQKPKDGMYLGHEVEATIIKSKVNQPWRTSKFKLYYPNPVKQDVEPEELETF